MAKFRTHYDNLKVSRDAPPEVIQAAYRSLARKHHPDANHGSREKAEATMKILNASYEVLSDPIKRAEHDRWIATQEQRNSSGLNSDHRDRQPKRDDLTDTVTRAVLMFAYFAAAFWMLRIPSLRVLGIVLIIAGWIFIKARPAR